MTADLELSVLQRPSEGLGYIAGFAITEQLVVAAGGTSSRCPTIIASSNARHFEPRKTPRQLGLRDVVAVGETLWACGEYGQLAMSRDQGATWKLLDTGTDACLFALALAPDGAVWVVGDRGYAARVIAERLERIELRTSARLAAVYAVRDEVVVLGFDGALYRWRGGEVARIATGSTNPLTALVLSKLGTWVVVGDGGFIARSPDGAWWTRVASGVELDLEASCACPDGKLMVVGDRGLILVSADDGRRWQTVPTELGLHLWAVERFGGGVLIGGDEGLIAKLAPPGDQTWQDRVDVFGGGKPLDAAFSPGPEGFIAHGLAAYLAAIGGRQAAGESSWRILREQFAETYGVAMPPELAAFLAATEGRDRWSTFAELRLDARVVPDAGEGNQFEQLVRDDQDARLATGLVEAFCGAFAIGSQTGGDAYFMELYDWDGARQILHFDHETHAFTGVCADSLDSLVYLASLERAHTSRRISDEALAAGRRKLRGKVAPRSFEGDTGDGKLVPLDPKRRDTEFFFYRSRWICALLDGRTDLSALPGLFNADFNQAVPQDQLSARYEACEKLIPTALYSMWRAFLFDEPELGSYLELGYRHRSRLVRDAARLIDELRAGRNELGRIRDVRAHLAAFRALDLDPRRAEQRRVERAWRSLDDGAAYRALVRELAAAPELTEQLAALDALHDLADGDREIMLPRLARELAPELEAVLVGGLVHGHAPDDDRAAPGWDAIDAALAPIYGNAEPHAHVGTVVPYVLGGNDPLHGISVYLRDEPVPHFHFVTYGFTDLFTKETSDPSESGFGFELTLRLRRAPGDDEVPAWVLSFLQNLARYVFGTGNRFAAGHKMGLNGPIAPEHTTALTAVLFAADPELGEIVSPFGRARFIQVVGITDDEYRLIQEWSTTGLVEILRAHLPFLVTDLGRSSVLAEPRVAAEVAERVARDGSSEDLSFAGEMQIRLDGEHVTIEMGALYAAAIPRSMRGRLRHQRGYTLRGRDRVLVLQPGERARHELVDGAHVIALPPPVIDEVEHRLRHALAGTYRFELWPQLEIVITPTLIRDQEGRVVEVRGVADPAEAQRLIDAENARLDAEHEHEAEEEDDDSPPSPRRVRAALALTERALRLAPDDDDTQFTHAMLLLDADRAGIAGKLDELVAAFPRHAAANQINIAVRMSKQAHPRFAEIVDILVGAPLPERMVGEVSTASFASYGDVADDLLGELGQAVLARAPERFAALVPRLPARVNLLSSLAWHAIQASRSADALALYERLLALPIPPSGEERTNYLRALNNACVQAHAAKAYDVAVRIAERAQPVAHENPYIFHSAACAYAAVGDYAKAFEQVKLAVEHDYDHLNKVEVDTDLGPLLEWPEFKALFREWRARQEGN